jgi:hypothetical protein
MVDVGDDGDIAQAFNGHGECAPGGGRTLIFVKEADYYSR